MTVLKLLRYQFLFLTLWETILHLTLFRVALLGAAHGWKAKVPHFSKICHTYPTTMNPGTVLPCLKKTPKKYRSPNTPFEFCQHQNFFTRNQQTLLYQEIQILIPFWYIIFNYFNFFCVFKDKFLINMVITLMMSVKVANLGLLKIKAFLNLGYDVMFFVHDVTNIILSRESNNIVDVIMWLEFGNSSILIRKVVITSIL